MEKDMMTRFRVIGACLALQAVTWETELKLISGLTCDIDLDQDFSTDIGSGVRLSDYSASEAIELLKETQKQLDTPPSCPDTYDSYCVREALLHPEEAIKRYEKDRERELWGDVKKRKKKKGHKKAREKRKREWKHYKKTLKALGVKLR